MIFLSRGLRCEDRWGRFRGGAWHYVQLFHVERPRSSYCTM